MRLESLDLTNFGPHKTLFVRPSPRLTGILGRNGSGKSSVLAAFELLLTGNCPTAGTKPANIRAGTPDKAVARVAGTISHNGQSLEIVRGLQRAKTELIVDGNGRHAVLGEAAVNQELLRIVGPALALAGEYLFVKQGAIFDILTATSAGRAQAFAQLFGTTEAERRWKLIGDRLARLEVPQRSPEIDTLKRRIADDQETLAGRRAARQAYADLKGYDRAADPDAQLVERYQAYRAARAEVARLTAAVAEAAAQFERTAGAVLRGETAAAADEAAVQAARPAADAARTALAAWRAYQAHVDQGTALEARRAELDDDVRRHPAPEAPPGYLTAEAAVAVQKAVEARIASTAWDRKFLRTFVQEGRSTCPTCGRPAGGPEMAALVAAAQARLATDEQELARDRARLAASAQHTQALARWQTWQAGHARAEQALAADVQAWQARAADYPRPGQSRAVLRQAVDALQAAEDQAKQSRGALVRVRQTADAAMGALAALRRERRQAIQTRRSLRCDRAEYRAARDRLAAVTVRLGERGQLLGEIQVLKDQLSQSQATCARLEAEAARGERLRTAVGRLERVRTVLHRDRLPRAVASGYLTLLERGINTLLDQFAAGFTVHTSEDLAFHATFPGGAVQPAARLSGGQKVLLALAFRVETNALFARDLGLLCLDEPTQFLDARNIGCLEPALAKLRGLADAKGLQCLLVTHERKLARLFDTVVQLP